MTALLTMPVLTYAAAAAVLFTGFILMLWLATGWTPAPPPSKFANRTVRTVPSVVPKRNDVGRQSAPKPVGLPIAVVGGAGFLAVSRRLNDVFIFDLNEPPKHFTDRYSNMKFVKVSITDGEALKKALVDNGIKISFIQVLSAVLTYMHHLTHQLKLSMDINYKGTVNVIEACLAAGVMSLAYVSTSHVSVGYDHFHFHEAINHYTLSKILESGIRLRTCIIGFGDRHATDAFLRSNTGQQCLVGGDVFCVSEDDPVSAVTLKDILRQAYPAMGPTQITPSQVLWIIGIISTVNQYLFKGRVSLGELDEMSLSCYQVIMSQQTFKSDKIKRVMGYKPLYTLEEAAVKILEKRKEVAKLYGGTVGNPTPKEN
ncbi:hypothetical protein BC829DRAFT_404377 [Chytridium lagenaria]|nr:hypothetical protein BC829DRAFT_404377 [Chytridium lagenaria]